LTAIEKSLKYNERGIRGCLIYKAASFIVDYVTLFATSNKKANKMENIDLWKIGLIVLICGIILTIVPIVFAFMKKVKLDKPKNWFNEANHFGILKERLIANENRIQGTLIFWKNQAAAHKLLHSSNTFWGIISAVSLPVLIQYYDDTDLWSHAFMTILTFWTGILFAVSHTFKSEEKYQGFRATESEYYDITRELLDTPIKEESELKILVNEYFATVEKIRKVARMVETESPPSARI